MYIGNYLPARTIWKYMHLKYIAKIRIAPTISAWPDPRSQHSASSEKSNVNSKIRRSAVGATRFASRGSRLVSSRAREQNGGTLRGNRQREERGRPPARWNRDKRDGKRTRIAPKEITLARLHLHEKEGEARRQSRNWDSTRRTTKPRWLGQSGSHHWELAEDERAARVAFASGGGGSSFDFERSSSAGAWIAS